MKLLLIGLGRWGRNHLKSLIPLVDELYVADSDPKQLEIRFLQSKERVYGLLKFRDYPALKAEEEDVKIHMIQRRLVGGRERVLISNQ